MKVRDNLITKKIQFGMAKKMRKICNVKPI